MHIFSPDEYTHTHTQFTNQSHRNQKGSYKAKEASLITETFLNSCISITHDKLISRLKQLIHYLI